MSVEESLMDVVGYPACNIMQRRRFLARDKKNKTYWSLIACISLLGPSLNYMEPRVVRMNRIFKPSVVWAGDSTGLADRITEGSHKRGLATGSQPRSGGLFV